MIDQVMIRDMHLIVKDYKGIKLDKKKQTLMMVYINSFN